MKDNYVADILDRALALESEHNDNPDWLGFEWHEVNAAPPTLNQMVAQGILKIMYRSRRYTNYRVANPIIAQIEAVAEEERYKPPDDLFDIIVGCEKVKNVFNLSLVAPRPVHILLHGPPATAKTLFLSEVARIPGSRYALGGSSTRAGILDFLLEAMPRYLIIDEIDKMSLKDHSVMLSLMETGTITRLKKGMTETRDLICWVFAGANNITKMPNELKSRFVRIEVPQYSEKEYAEVVYSVLTKREDVDPGIARYIGVKLASCTKDVRDAVKLGRMASSVQEVDELLGVVT